MDSSMNLLMMMVLAVLVIFCAKTVTADDTVDYTTFEIVGGVLGGILLLVIVLVIGIIVTLNKLQKQIAAVQRYQPHVMIPGPPPRREIYPDEELSQRGYTLYNGDQQSRNSGAPPIPRTDYGRASSDRGYANSAYLGDDGKRPLAYRDSRYN